MRDLTRVNSFGLGTTQDRHSVSHKREPCLRQQVGRMEDFVLVGRSPIPASRTFLRSALRRGSPRSRANLGSISRQPIRIQPATKARSGAWKRAVLARLGSQPPANNSIELRIE